MSTPDLRQVLAVVSNKSYLMSPEMKDTIWNMYFRLKKGQQPSITQLEVWEEFLSDERKVEAEVPLTAIEKHEQKLKKRHDYDQLAEQLNAMQADYDEYKATTYDIVKSLVQRIEQLEQRNG